MKNTKQSIPLTDLRSMPRVKRMVYQGPLLLTQNGTPEFVLMTVSDFEQMQKDCRKAEQAK